MTHNFDSIEKAFSALPTAHGATGIECHVAHCHYNRDSHLCQAGHIKVGPANACCTEETICATFRPQGGSTRA